MKRWRCLGIVSACVLVGAGAAAGAPTAPGIQITAAGVSWSPDHGTAYIVRTNREPTAVRFEAIIRDAPVPHRESVMDSTTAWFLTPTDDRVTISPTDGQSTRLSVTAGPVTNIYRLGVTTTWNESPLPAPAPASLQDAGSLCVSATVAVCVMDVDLDGQEPAGSIRVDVADPSEVTPGVLLASERTRLLVQYPGTSEGVYTLRWTHPAPLKRLQLREIVGEQPSGDWHDSGFSKPCVGSWPKVYDVQTTGPWDLVDTADVVLSHSLVSCTDTVRLVKLKVDFVRLHDIHNIANRSTRAVDPFLRRHDPSVDSRTGPGGLYEDNPRSDVDRLDHQPMLALAGWCEDSAEAHVRIKAQFKPPDAGGKILWKVKPVSNGVSVNGADHGDFSAAATAVMRLVPAAACPPVHPDRDFEVKVGVDRDADGVLSDVEAFDVAWGLRVFGKAEHDPCDQTVEEWWLWLSYFVYPDAYALLHRFMGGGWPTGTAPSSESDDTIAFADVAYSQKNGLGCHPTTLAQGRLQNCVWNADRPFSRRVMIDEEFWQEVVVPALPALAITNWYRAHPGVLTHTFETDISGLHVDFDDTLNLVLSLNEAGTDLHLELDTTVDGYAAPRITRFRASGKLKDLYDWPSARTMDRQPCAAKMQTCHVADALLCGPRKAKGDIFRVEIGIDNTVHCPGTGLHPAPVPLDDTASLRTLWLLELID